MDIKIHEVQTKGNLRKFIHFPASIHKNHDAWIPPIYADEWNFFNPKKNSEFANSDTILLLALNGKKTVGRIMGLINTRYNELHKEKNGRFIFMECVNSQVVAHALIHAIEKWALGKGMTKLIGPLGFSDKDPQGFLIEGYEHRAIIDTTCNHPYMVELIKNEGYSKEVDLHDYLVKVPEVMPVFYERIFTRVSHKADFKVVEFKSRKELKPYIIPVLELMNETYMHIYGFVPLTEREMRDLAKRYLPILDPDFVKAVTIADEVIAFVIAMPDVSDGLKKSKGYLFPFGLLQILKSLKKADHLVLLLGAVKPKYRGMGTDALMAVKLLDSAMKRNMKTIESHLILETNGKMIAEVIKADGEIFKKFRIFQKDL